MNSLLVTLIVLLIDIDDVKSTNIKKNECWGKHWGICVSNEDACPFNESQTISFNENPCGTINRKCCVPSQPKPEKRVNSLCGTRSESRARIVGGVDSKSGKWPWHVNLLHTNSFHSTIGCGGSIIHPRWILTAAHCVENNYAGNDDVKIIAGNYNKELSTKPFQTQKIKAVHIHKDFRSRTYIKNNIKILFKNDIALLELDNPFILGRYVNSVCLPNINENMENLICTVTGFGWTNYSIMEQPEILQQVDLPIVPLKTCLKHNLKENTVILNQNICAGFISGERAACKDDSGGPLMCLKSSLNHVYQYVQAGIVSWSHKPCGRQETGDVFTAVAEYLNWIEFITKLPFYDGRYANDPEKEFIYKNVTIVDR